MDLIHGSYEFWCALCMAKAQLDYAKARAEAIPELEAKVASLEAA